MCATPTTLTFPPLISVYRQLAADQRHGGDDDGDNDDDDDDDDVNGIDSLCHLALSKRLVLVTMELLERNTNDQEPKKS